MLRKATGVDNISLLLLKQASSIIAQPLTKLINKSMQQSIFLDDTYCYQVLISSTILIKVD
jgi:hypothetical protein